MPANVSRASISMSIFFFMDLRVVVRVSHVFVCAVYLMYVHIFFYCLCVCVCMSHVFVCVCVCVCVCVGGDPGAGSMGRSGRSGAGV